MLKVGDVEQNNKPEREQCTEVERDESRRGQCKTSVTSLILFTLNN